MNRYTIYCTEEQTKKAMELGAPIEICDTEVDIENKNIGSIVREEGFLCKTVKLEDYLYDEDGNRLEYNVLIDGTEETGRIVAFAPTAEQMIGWLKEQGCTPYIHPVIEDGQEVLSARLKVMYKSGSIDTFCKFDKGYSVIRAAIDSALEYLSNNKK